MSTATFYEHELTEWNRSIEFFLQELSIFKERLGEIASKNTKQPVLANVEHFQNQFILQKENFDILKHDIHVQLSGIKADIQTKNKLTDLNIMESQHFLREREQLSEKIFLELKHSFYRFLSAVF